MPRGAHDGGEIRQIEGQLDLGILVVGHVGFEGVLDAVLGREVAGHEGGAAGGAHAGATEGVVEREALPLQAHGAGKILRFPALWEMLDGPFLIGDEEDDIHPGDIPPLALVAMLAAVALVLALGRGVKCGPADGDRGPTRSRLQEIAAAHLVHQWLSSHAQLIPHCR
jgi:hypothetical protein